MSENNHSLEIALTKGYTTLIDMIDSDLANLKWCAKERSRNYVSAMREEKGKHKLLHRVILERILGRELTEGEEVDHINCNPLDNRRANLRVATHSQNMHNLQRSPKNTSGYKGVSKMKRGGARPYRAYITVNYKTKFLGLFATAEEAHKAYCDAAKQYHGDFARGE